MKHDYVVVGIFNDYLWYLFHAVKLFYLEIGFPFVNKDKFLSGNLLNPATFLSFLSAWYLCFHVENVFPFVTVVLIGFVFLTGNMFMSVVPSTGVTSNTFLFTRRYEVLTSGEMDHTIISFLEHGDGILAF